MNKFTLISSILRRAWLIDPNWASNNISLIADVISGKMADFGQDQRRSSEERVCTLSRLQGTTLFTPSYWSGFQNAPEGSIAMIDIIGPIMKYGYCSDGSYELNQLIQEAKASANIKALFGNIDCPGGQVEGIATFADSIKNFGKPSLAFINEGIMASAAVVFGSAFDEIYASQPLDSVGCVGVYQTLYDQSERLKQMGIKVTDRYAPQSTEKNKTYKEAQKGKYDLLDKELFAVAESIINTVASNRGARLNGDPAEWNKGQTGFATWAVEIGMIDGICTYEDALARLDDLCNGAESKASVDITPKIAQNNQTIKMDELEALMALAGVENPTDEQIDQANACLTVNNITGATIVRESFIQEAGDISGQLEQANAALETANNLATSTGAELATANTNLATVNTSLNDANATIADLQRQVEAFGQNAGALHNSSAGNDTPPEGADNSESILNNLAHNKTADKVLGVAK